MNLARHAFLLSLLFSVASAQPYTISTIAGIGHFTGDGGLATAAQLSYPVGIAITAAGEAYIADTGNHRIRKVDAAGKISTVAGNGSNANTGDGGLAINAATGSPDAIVIDPAGNVYFTTQNRVRKLDTNGVITTIAGGSSLTPNGTCTPSGDGGPAANAAFCTLAGLVRDSKGTFYVSDNNYNGTASFSRIRAFTAGGNISTIAGGAVGNTGNDGPALAATFGSYIQSLAVDQADNLYISDSGNGSIRKIDSNRIITAIPVPFGLSFSLNWIGVDPSGALFYSDSSASVYKLVNGTGVKVVTLQVAPLSPYVSAFQFDSRGNLFVSDQLQVWKLPAGGDLITFAGSQPPGVFSTSGTRATDVRFNFSSPSLAADNAGNVYFFESLQTASSTTTRLDKVTPDGTLIPILGPTVSLPNSNGTVTATLSGGRIAVDPTGQTIYFSQFFQIFKFANGTVTRFAGKIQSGFLDTGDGGPALDAVLGLQVSGMALDKQGNLYIAETGGQSSFDNNVIRQIDTNGIIHRYAGTGSGGFAEGPPLIAQFRAPQGIAFDATGNMYIADFGNHRVRKIDVGRNQMTTIAGNGNLSNSPDGPALTAAMTGPGGITVDSNGKLFFSSPVNHLEGYIIIVPTYADNRVRTIDTNGNMVTVAGSGQGGTDYGDGRLATEAELNEPQGMAADGKGNLYVFDWYSNKIRKLTPGAPPTVTSVNSVGGSLDIAGNTWIEIKGTNLAPAGTSLVWSTAPEFAQGKMPTKLGTVSVTVNGKPAYIYFVSPGQVNVLTPLEATTGPVQIVVTNGPDSSVPFNVARKAVAPGFFLFGATKYIAATHANGTLLGPDSMSVPGYTFTPATVNETVTLYANGFGAPGATLTEGASSQFGALPTLPVIQINGFTATVTFAGVVAPGLFQFNVIIPAGAKDGDNSVTCTYGGSSVPLGALLAVKK